MEDPLQPGLLLVDRFRVVRRIAHGGMGVVYEAYDEKLGRRIALKCARVGHDRHLRPEVRLATEVSHPNICKIYEIHATESPQGPLEFVTMELLEGPTLANRLKEDPPLPPQEAETIARGLCAGLAEAHRLQIIHGDLKSANVILARNPDGTLRAVITDFGLARAASVSGVTGGTRGYMAPELYQGAPTTIASDIYALGVILYEMVSGGILPQERAAMQASTVTQHPSDAAVTPDGKQRLADPSQTKPPPLRSRWDKILKTCLASDPRERYQSADQVLTALGPSVLRRRVLVAVGALAFAAVAALATYRTSTAPAQSVKLDIAAIDAAPALATTATELRRDALRTIGELKNSAQTAFSVRTTSWGSRATHRFSASLTPKGDKLALHAVLVDLRSGAPVIDWSADYAPAQLRYAPVALAGVVSRALHLPAITTYATVSPAAAASYQRGMALSHDDSKLDESLSALREAAARDPDSALPLAAMAEVERRRFFLTKLGSWKAEAQSSFEQADLRNSDCAEVHRIAGLLEYDRNQLEQAIASMSRAIELQPHPDAFRRLGAFYFESGQFPEALQAYSQAERLAPKDVRVYQDLANLYTSQSDFEKASKALEKTVELAPNLPRFRRMLASSYQNQGRFPEAEAQLRTALRQEDSGGSLEQLGHVLLYEKRETEAIPLLSRSVGLDGADSIAWLYLGLAYQRSRNIAGARKAFERGLSAAEQELILLPRVGHAHALVAYLCAQTGQAGRARVEAAQALQLAPRNNETIWWAALTYERIGDRAAALQTLQSAPRALLEDLRRWPEASMLTSDERFSNQFRSNPNPR